MEKLKSKKSNEINDETYKIPVKFIKSSGEEISLGNLEFTKQLESGDMGDED